MKQHFFKLQCFAIVVATFVSQSVRAGDERPERHWEMHFPGFFRDGTEPLYLYATERNGEWMSVVGSSRSRANPNHKTYNRSYYPGDLSAAPIKGGRMKGRLILHMTPDQWVPLDHKSYTIEIDIDANVANDSVAGIYRIIAANSTDKTADQFMGKAGAITGVTRPGTPFDRSAPFTIQINLQGALVGGRPDFGERCIIVRLGIDGGTIVSATQGRLNAAQAATGFERFDLTPSSISIGSAGFKGRLAIHSKTVDEEPATYTFDIDGHIYDDTTVGTYAESVVIEGKEAVKLDGSFDGKLSHGAKNGAAAQRDDRPWWTPSARYHPLQTAEHPRLLFRKSDLPALRIKAETREGKAIIERLRRQLNGGDGQSMPTVYSNAYVAYDKSAQKDLPLGAYTISHVAGYGLLYQLTGDPKYADLGRQCFEVALKGQRDRDDRYCWKGPVEALRAGATVGWYAVGYDLCYDGWDAATREKFGSAIEHYDFGAEHPKAGAVADLESLARGTMPPASNHFGLQVGGAAMALMAVTGEPWVDQPRIDRLLKVNEASLIRNMTEGFGDGGFFAEGDGTGSMSSQIAFLTALQSSEHALGKDFINVERPNARMMTLKWIYLTVVRNGKPEVWPIRGGYPHNVWSRELSGMGYFALGFGAVTAEQRSAMKWYYDRYLLQSDIKADGPYDTVSHYPHSSVCAFVNWPVDLPGRNPAAVLPLCYRDSTYGFYAWRNRWQDDNDIVISVLTKPSRGFMSASPDGGLEVQAFGRQFKWAQVAGETKSWWTSPRGEASVLTMADGTSVAVDFTRSSGAVAMLVTTGAAEGRHVTLGASTLTFTFLGASSEPAINVEGDNATVGQQTVSIRDGSIVLGTTTPK